MPKTFAGFVTFVPQLFFVTFALQLPAARAGASKPRSSAPRQAEVFGTR